MLAAAEKQVELAEAERVAADKQRRESDTRAKTVAIALADARVAAIQAAVETAAAAAAASTLTADAWPRVPQMLRRSALAGEITQVRVALDAANEDAAPLRERRDALLRTLRGVLDAQVRAADAELTKATEQWRAADEAEREADRALADATGAGKELDGRIREITRQVEAHYEAVKAAVIAGLLTIGVAPRDTLGQARTEVASAASEVERLKDVRGEFAGELPKLRSRLTRAADEASQAEQRHAQKRHAVAGVLDERARLAAHPLLAELGAEDADLELVGADLANRVAAEADRQRALAIAGVAATAEDQRAADTLDRDRLLPARAEVEALCRTLAKERVTSAVPGWRYLVEAVPTAQHAAAIAAHPALVDGIVVATHDLDRARDVLAGTNPSAAILIAAGSVLADTGAPAAAGWVVPPAAALHDRSAAEAELDRRQDRIAKSEAQAEDIAAAEHTARALADALTTHLDAWPTGALPAAVAERDELERAAAAARTAAVDARTAVETVEGWLEETDGQLEHQRTRLRSAEGLTARLEQLATAADTTAKAERELASLQKERTGLAKAADCALAARTAERDRREAAAARKATAQQALDGASQVLAGLPEVGDGPAAPLANLAELRAGYESTVRNVAETTTDSELSRQLARLERDRTDAETEWQALDGQLRSRVEELAASPAAVDPVARRTADQEARRAAREAANIHARALSRLDIAKATRRSLPDPEPTWPVEPFDIPTDLPALEAFSISLEAEAARTREQRTIAIDKVTAAKTGRDTRLGEHDALAAQVAGLTHGVGEREVRPASPFEGDAAAEVKSALRAITDAGHIREDADLNWRRAATAVARWARDEKWKELTGDLARRLRDEDPDLLARDAAEMLAQTRILEDRLRDNIGKLDTHRQMLLTSLGDAVSEATRSLRIARKKSELPAGLGDWSHQPFLKIGCELAKDRTELDARLRRYINDLLERASTVGLPTGADLVCQAVLACAERTVTVEVLKPNKAQRLRYVPITETATLSGGMRATAAIAMFCTLAKVRAANRTGRVGVGTLVLDNPLGDANATYLVALQRLVAQMSDVQLVYATGVNDMDALRLFPVVTRLTNEAAKRSHLAYVVADEAFLKRLAPADGDNAIITGARLVRRQQPLLAVDLPSLADDEEDDV
ncbi:MAG TPA: hypothetical protein VG276_14040 [Actinomycetes bacterium]|nr:hypothetical protein [Actinomycetes bacterium]